MYFSAMSFGPFYTALNLIHIRKQMFPNHGHKSLPHNNISTIQIAHIKKSLQLGRVGDVEPICNFISSLGKPASSLKQTVGGDNKTAD